MHRANSSEEEAVVSIFSDPITSVNLIAVCILWSTAGFVTYLLLYYSKYFSGNFYINYASQGASDIISMSYINFLSRQNCSALNILKILLYSVILFTLLEIMVTEMSLLQSHPKLEASVVPILLLMIRMNIGSIQNYGYHINQLLFPVMMRGQSYGITNFVSRPFASVATIVVEYTHHPLLFILPLACFANMSINQIREVDYENGRFHSGTSQDDQNEEDLAIIEEGDSYQSMNESGAQKL